MKNRTRRSEKVNFVFLQSLGKIKSDEHLANVPNLQEANKVVADTARAKDELAKELQDLATQLRQMQEK